MPTVRKLLPPKSVLATGSNPPLAPVANKMYGAYAFSGRSNEAAAEQGLPADGALRPQDRGVFEV